MSTYDNQLTEMSEEQFRHNQKEKKVLKTLAHIGIYTVCIIFTLLSLIPFWFMISNATRTTSQIYGKSLSLVPSTHLVENYKALMKTDEKGQASSSGTQNFDPVTGFRNSFIVSAGATVLAIYFSTLTAYAIVVYDWKLKRAFFTFIMAVMMIPTQVTAIGFYLMVFRVHLNGTLWPLILPSIASPAMVIFMKQYMQPALSLEIIQSARIDGAGEFYTFNKIALPIMKPAMATQAIFAFVSSWNNLFLPSILLSSNAKLKTLPMMVALLKGDIYKVNMGALYLAITISILPLFIVYFALSKYIIAGVALGSVKG